NRISLDRTEHFARHRLVNPQAAKRKTAGLTVMQMRIIAVVARHEVLLAGVGDVKHSSTPPATKDAGEQRAAATASFGVSVGLHMGICRQQSLISFILLPANVPGMVVGNQDAPRGSRF